MIKKKRIKKIVLSLIMIATLIFSGGVIVFADGGSNGSNSGGGGGGTTCSSCSCTYGGDNLAIYGVRLSVINYENGYKLSGTKVIDIFAVKDANNSYQKQNLWVISGESSTNKYNRADMVYATNYGAGSKIIQYYDSNPTLTSTTWNNLGIYSASDMNWGSSVSFNYGNISTKIDYAGFIQTLFKTMQDEVTKYNQSGNINDLTIVNNIFVKLNLKGNGTSPGIQNYSEEALKTLYLAVEPLVAMPVKGTGNTDGTYRYFYGTITQLAYAFQAKNCVSDSWNGWSLSASLVHDLFGVLLYGTRTCNTSSDPKYCNPTNWNPVDAIPSSGNDMVKALTGYGSSTPYSYGIGYIWLGGLGMVPTNGCDSAVGYINDLYKNKKITQTEYETYIKQIINGKFSLKDEGTGNVYEVKEVQNWELLKKEAYIKYNSGYAACSEIPVDTKDCDAAVEYINKNYTKNTDEYHDAISSVRDGTFKYEVTDAKGKTTIVKIDKAYSFDKLKKSVYMKKGGTAACEDLDNICEIYDGYTAEIDDCDTGKTYFKDIEEEDAWLTCEIAYTKDGTIYSSDNTGHDAVESSNGGIVGNKEYCELFCYEDFETAFPTNVYGVKAGRTFTWGSPDGIFGTVRVTKKCSTQTYVKGQQGYRFEEWEEDYKANEEALIKYYMNKASYEKEKNTITTSSSGKYTDCWKCSTCTNKDGSSYSCHCRYTCKYRYSGTATSSSQSHSYSHSYVGGITGSAGGQSVSTGYSYITSSEAKAAAKEMLINRLNSLASSELGKYNSKLTSEAALLVKIRQCTNNLEYLYKTTVQFTFQEPTNSVYGANTRGFSFDDDLKLEGNYNTNNVDTSKCKKKTVYSYKCSGSGSSATCTATKQSVLDCTMVTWNITGNYTYKYPTEKFQWYSLKTDSTLVNKENKGSEDEAFFYSIGFGLPTAFSLTDGTYELKVTVNNIGDNAEMKGDQDYNRPNGHFAPITNAVNVKAGTGYGFDYSCIYQVENEIFGNDCQYDSNGKLTSDSPEYCDSKKDKDSNGSLVGIDIAFRLVQLLEDTDSIDKAFPSIDGDGRENGRNWNLEDSKIHEILDADIYKESQAMYEIMLDVNAIQYIRRDNQEYFDAGKDPYTSYVNENNTQKVYCATDSAQQKYCASDFISDLYSGSGLNYPLKGTCLPTSNTLQRAEYILEHGCDTTYTYPTINWTR